MTITSTSPREIKNGNGTATVFSFTFVVNQASDLVVTLVDANGVEAVLTEGTGTTNYSVSVSSYPGAGSVTYPASLGTQLQTGEQLIIQRVVDIDQETDLVNQGAWKPEQVENTFDYSRMIDLQQQDELDRSIKASASSPIGTNYTLPAPESLALFRWNEAATELENVQSGDIITTSFFSNFATDAFADGVDYTAGTTTQLTLTASPGTIGNTQVYFDGVYQEKSNYALAGQVITFDVAIPLGVIGVEVVYGRAADVLAPSTREIQIGDGLKTAYTLANAYDPSNGTLHVYINGVRQEVNYGYVETNANTVTFDSAPGNGDIVLFLVNPFVNQTTAAASSVSYNNATSGLTATTAQGAIDELRSADNITYSNTTSGLTGTNVQAAIDELLPKTDATSYGFYTTRNATDTTNDVDISAGQCWDTTRTAFLQGSAMTKQLDANWAAGTNAGMLDTGTVSSSEGYHIYAMISDVDGSVDYLASLQSTWTAVSAKPTNYTKGQIIGFIYRDSAPSIRQPVWSGNHCQYKATGVQSFTDSVVTQQQFETYSINSAPANAICNWQVFSDDVGGTGDGKRIGVRYADGTADFVTASASYMAYFTQFGLSTVNVTRGTASFDFQVNESQEIMILSTEYATTTITAFIRGFWMPYRLEATS
jgi:hypothetical protein